MRTAPPVVLPPVNDATEVTGVELRRMLERLAANLAFSWLPAVREVFRDLDRADWQASDHNPIVLLAGVTDDRFERLAADDDYVRRVVEAVGAAQHEFAGSTWWAEEHSRDDFLAAYFSTEFALDESLPVYSGGLGVLAGDHLKSASELGVPLVGVGLFYERGYFRQTLDETGWQNERYPRNDPARLPLTLERRPSGEPLHVQLELAGEPVALQIWRADIGRTRLYLLDANVDTNSDSAASITDKLYGGDREHRIRQEVVLGVGGVRALRLLGLAPTVFHMNEGHSAFLAIERVRELTAAGRPLARALDEVRGSTVFTTHTPVPAGNEVFEPALVQRYLSGVVAGAGMEWDDFLALGRVTDNDLFGLTPLALRLAGSANGVSALHGSIAREMWQPLWPDKTVDEVPIGSVTNGVHARTWLAGELATRLGGDWSRVHEIPDEELWRIHLSLKRDLFAVAASRGNALTAGEDALTIGFARRFATYKRAGLLFSDPDRLARVLANAQRPVQVLLAGKSHPADEGGKALIREIWELTRDSRFQGRVVFLEDYQMTLARQLVQGVDVWLNTPRRPQEASGTSGMKAAMNGVVNFSILDGWWAEAYSPEVGFAIGGEPDAANEDEQDARDAASLFDVLESELVPAYYERDERGLPHRWLELMRASIEQLGSEFNTNRIVREYVETMYLPADAALAGAIA
ncbi:MAG: glycogen phosphorylase [Gaiellaceae bacterium]|nr:glycogen phosphorylase [Gaiellaceae bacterium]